MSQGYDAEICSSTHFKHFFDNESDGHSWVKANLSGRSYYIDGNAGYPQDERLDPKVIPLYLHSPDPNSLDRNVYQQYNHPEETFLTIYDIGNLNGWDWWNSTGNNTGLKYQDQVRILEDLHNKTKQV